MSDFDSDSVELFARFAALQRRRVRLNAEIDNVRELIRSKGF